MWRNLLKKIAIKLIDAYQSLMTAVRPNSPCRFTPTCSNYAKDAIGRYGILEGIVKAGARIGRCHPFSSGGHDPVK